MTVSRAPTGSDFGPEYGERSPAELLVAWRATERRYAATAAGTREASTLHAEMRLLMDEYEWNVRGRAGSLLQTPQRRR